MVHGFHPSSQSVHCTGGSVVAGVHPSSQPVHCTGESVVAGFYPSSQPVGVQPVVEDFLPGTSVSMCVFVVCSCVRSGGGEVVGRCMGMCSTDEWIVNRETGYLVSWYSEPS